MGGLETAPLLAARWQPQQRLIQTAQVPRPTPAQVWAFTLLCCHWTPCCSLPRNAVSAVILMEPSPSDQLCPPTSLLAVSLV